MRAFVNDAPALRDLAALSATIQDAIYAAQEADTQRLESECVAAWAMQHPGRRHLLTVVSRPGVPRCVASLVPT